MMFKNRVWKIAGIATGSAIVAWICGEEFISKQVGWYSLAISLFFIIALVPLGWGAYQGRSHV